MNQNRQNFNQVPYHKRSAENSFALDIVQYFHTYL